MIKKLTTMFVFLFVLASQNAMADNHGQKLFVNLNSDGHHKAAMAIKFSTGVLKRQKIPVTIFLNAEGSRLANANVAGKKIAANGKSIKAMLIKFMDTGGKVIVCPMCLKNIAGISKNDIIDGMVLGGPKVTMPAMFAENTTVLSY